MLSPNSSAERSFSKTGSEVNMFEIYCDGGCVPNPGFGSWGFVKVSEGKPILENSGFVERATNNRMEILAFIESVKTCKVDDDFTVYSDSLFLVKLYNEWMHGWEALGWRRKKGEVKNLDLIKELWLIYKHYKNIKLKWIRGHSGHIWNERADELCSMHIKNAFRTGKIDKKYIDFFQMTLK